MNKYLSDSYNELNNCLDNVQEDIKWMENHADIPEDLEHDPEYLDLIDKRDELRAQISNIYDG